MTDERFWPEWAHGVCRCGARPGTFIPAPGHMPSNSVDGQCYADGQAWPCRASVELHFATHKETDQ